MRVGQVFVNTRNNSWRRRIDPNGATDAVPGPKPKSPRSKPVSEKDGLGIKVEVHDFSATRLKVSCEELGNPEPVRNSVESEAWCNSRLPTINVEFPRGGALLADRPEWAEVRWINLEGGEGRLLSRVVEHVLGTELGDHHSSLAMESWHQAKVRRSMKMHIFDDVLFVIAKLPSLGAEFTGKENLVPLAQYLKTIAHMAECTVLEYDLVLFLVALRRKTVITIQTGKDGDCWDSLRRTLQTEPASSEHGFVRHRSVHTLFWNLLNEALSHCHKANESISDILETIEAKFEKGQRNKLWMQVWMHRACVPLAPCGMHTPHSAPPPLPPPRGCRTMRVDACGCRTRGWWSSACGTSCRCSLGNWSHCATFL